jgi:hypothetical protein
MVTGFASLRRTKKHCNKRRESYPEIEPQHAALSSSSHRVIVSLLLGNVREEGGGGEQQPLDA